MSEFGDYLLEQAQKDSKGTYLRTLVSLFEGGHKLIKSLTVPLNQQELVDMMMMTFSRQANRYLDDEIEHLAATYERKLSKWRLQVSQGDYYLAF